MSKLEMTDSVYARYQSDIYGLADEGFSRSEIAAQRLQLEAEGVECVGKPEEIKPIRLAPDGTGFQTITLLGAPAMPTSYTFTQGTPAYKWKIVHGLSFTPTVTVMDSEGYVIEATIRYLSATEVEISFSAPTAGKAVFS